MKRFHYETIDSTNSQAARLVHQGEHAPFLVSATTQTSGRGRSGRVWQSPAGGAWISAAWPIKSDPVYYSTFPLVTGLAVWQTIFDVVNRTHSCAEDRLKIKWPNDILLDGQKFCGILCETSAKSGEITHLIAGVGINIGFSSSELTGQLRHPPTSLNDHFSSSNKWIEPIIQEFQKQFLRQMNYLESYGFDHKTYSSINNRLAFIGHEKAWQFRDQQCSGFIEGIDSLGRLLINIDGEVRPFDSGEICAIECVAT